jgi:hypothetical protein
MNRIIKMLTMTGLGVFAAASVGAGPAMAATGGTQTPAKPASPAAKAKPAAPSRTRILDIYPSRGSCEYAGRLGERDGDWEDYDCFRTAGGYALQISFDSWGDWNDWNDNDWNGPWGIHGHGGGFHGIGDIFRGHGGGHRGHGGSRGHGHNGVGAVPGNPSNIPPIGTPSPS